MRLAALLGARFSLLSGSEPEQLLRQRARRYGIAHRLASIRPIGTPAPEGNDDPQRSINAAVTAAADCVATDGAHIIVIGPIHLAGTAPIIQQALAERGLDIVVVDPRSATTRALETMAAMHLSPSLRTYPRRSEKLRVWPETRTVGSG